MNILEAFILGIVQGITEWLPISSSGHLVIVQKLLHADVPLSFDVALHFASIFAVIVFFYKEIFFILKKFFTLEWGSYEGRLALFIILASIPTFLIGFFLRKWIDLAFSSLFAVFAGLLFSGFILFLASFFNKEKRLNAKNSLMAGIFQGIAIFPGISRSGSVISSLVISGVERREAVRFTFLLAIPAVLGATLLKVRDFALLDFSSLFVGFITTFIVSFFAIYLLIATIQKNLRIFAYYCFILAFILLLFIIFFR